MQSALGGLQNQMENEMTYELPRAIAARAMREADADIRAKHKRGQFDDGDPNHPKYNNGINYTTGQPATLFGYDTETFMARQYR